ncbi:13908_t:CDS:2 [Acaulospora morrowiae]|uniref:13908_t:CDS:1 n=1 Tax=Acaulospora morrowiae TaxID=94023 RepID=A0A9N8V5A6_9GLOM|nr:13908_t:CDS:2 [Acaulospora morrowiae]
MKPLISIVLFVVLILNVLFKPAYSAGPIRYLNGPIMSGPIPLYIVYYGNQWHSFNQKLIESFLNGVSGTSYWDIAKEYTGFVDESHTKAGKVTGPVKVAKSLNLNATHGVNLNRQNLFTIINNQIHNGRFPEDDKGIYFVLTSKEVAYGDSELVFCEESDRGMCGYHFSFPASGGKKKLKYSFVGDPGHCPATCIRALIDPSLNSRIVRTPNGDTLDSMISVISHELFETVTNPLVNINNAWLDSDGFENADKCQPYFQPLQNKNGASYNLKIGSNLFLVQQIWNPRTQRCELSDGKNPPL